HEWFPQGSRPADRRRLRPGRGGAHLAGWMAQVDEVRFTNVRVATTAVLGGTEGQGWETLEAAALQAIPILCAYQVGSCQTVFDMAVGHSPPGVQLCPPLWRLHPLQHPLL